MNTCKDCRWWDWMDRDDPDDPEPMPKRAMCDLTRDYSTRGPAHPESKAVAGGNGETSVLWTRPDFGCVQFERIKPPLADHFYVPVPKDPDPRLFGCSIVPVCFRCGRLSSEHPQREKQTHQYVEGMSLVQDWEFWRTLGCVTCERPRWGASSSARSRSEHDDRPIVCASATADVCS